MFSSFMVGLLKAVDWCVCGDFNAIRCPQKRMSIVIGSSHEDLSSFDQLVDCNILFDLSALWQTLYLVPR